MAQSSSSSLGTLGTIALAGIAGWVIGGMLFPSKPTLADYEEFLDEYEAGDVDEDGNEIDDDDGEG